MIQIIACDLSIHEDMSMKVARHAHLQGSLGPANDGYLL